MKLNYLNLKQEWDLSYKNLDNLLFYPNENVVKFLNKFINRKIKLKTKKSNKYFIDLGCGAGRHIKYLVESGYKCIGIDFSSTALQQAKNMLDYQDIDKSRYKLLNCNSTSIPLKNNSIDYVISDGSLDSMPSQEIVRTVNEIYRVIKKGCLFYVNLIGKGSNNHQSGRFINSYDFLITSEHEKNTIQSYFTEKRIKKIFKNFKTLYSYTVTEKVKNKAYFKTLHGYIPTEKVKNKVLSFRYHLILKK